MVALAVMFLLTGCDAGKEAERQGCDSAASDPVDGVDQNCDGVDGTDADGDGVAGVASGGSDCDDAEPEVYPGSVEWCDGVDNDCDGVVDEEDTIYTGGETYMDADGDGYHDLEPSGCVGQDASTFEGEDCDDTRQDVYPGAAEVCGDGALNDCNGTLGEVWEDCTDFTTTLAEAENIIVGAENDYNFGFSVAAVSEEDTSGLLVGAVESIRGATGGGAAMAFLEQSPGLSCDSEARATEEGAAVAFTDQSPYTLLGPLTPDDAWWILQDDDSPSSLGTSAAYVSGFFGGEANHAAIGADRRSSVFIVKHAACGATLDVESGDSLELYRASSGSPMLFGFALSPAGDVDQDGRGDILVGAPGEEDGGAAGEAWIVLGGDELFYESALDVSVFASRVGPSDDSSGNFGTSVAGLRDVDGDGLEEVGAAARSCSRDVDTAYILAGADLTDEVMGTALAAEDAAGKITCAWEDEDESGAHAIARAGDVDEDGYADILLGGRSGAVYLFAGTPRLRAWDMEEAQATLTRGGCSTCLPDEEDYAYKYAKSSLAGDADLNGDGHVDLAIGDPAYDGGDADAQQAGAVYIVFGPDVPSEVSLDDDNAPTYRGSDACDWAGYSVAMADLDLDGLDDLVVGVPSCNDDNKRVGFVTTLLGVEL